MRLLSFEPVVTAFDMDVVAVAEDQAVNVEAYFDWKIEECRPSTSWGLMGHGRYRGDRAEDLSLLEGRDVTGTQGESR